MSVEPLPFDSRPACFCRQNCPGFKQPPLRWWVVYQTCPPTIPELCSGVLVEFSFFVPFSRACVFEPEILPAGITSLALELIPLPPFPGDEILKATFVDTNVGDQNNFDEFESVPCENAFVLPVASGTLLIGPATLTPVRWFQNANDVPH